jgi:hypothetical protein
VKTDPVAHHKPRLPSSHLDANKTFGIDFHGASIINEYGEEIPITESMVQQAFKIYIKQWEIAQKSSANN